MFDIGFSELFVIAIVALLVLGPERLPKAARFAGLWVRRARAQWYSVKSELENELADDELKRSLLQTRDQLHGEMRQLRDGLQHGAQTVQGEFKIPESAPVATTAVTAAPPGTSDAGTPVETSPVERRPVGSRTIEAAPLAITGVDNASDAGTPDDSCRRDDPHDHHDRR